ncbi:hypothetical protein H7I56_05595, partial [Mycolicibacterium gilvum]|nr:hypothetical protein [Mycolicibacterium gilvum]
MDQPNVFPHRRAGTPTSIRRSVVTGATTAALAAALALPGIANAQPAPTPTPAPPPPAVG